MYGKWVGIGPEIVDVAVSGENPVLPIRSYDSLNVLCRDVINTGFTRLQVFIRTRNLPVLSDVLIARYCVKFRMKGKGLRLYKCTRR